MLRGPEQGPQQGQGHGQKQRRGRRVLQFVVRSTVLPTLAWLAVGCADQSPSSAVSPFGPGRDGTLKPVSRDQYLNGRKFCEEYQSITGKEFGIRVKVPRDHENPAAGKIEIYAYTLAPFNPEKPSYIFVDGGPGQNTHGLMPPFLGTAMNEIRFDQRGVGCSAPETWEEYLDARLYSSLNTVRDLDMIREAYGIQSWSVYGVSYGTIPATMYGSHYPSRTKSVVLEGVAGRSEDLHDSKYKAEKLNLFIANFTTAQERAFVRVYFGRDDSPEAKFLAAYMRRLFYRDAGFRRLLAGTDPLFKIVPDYRSFSDIISPSGELNLSLIRAVERERARREPTFRFPQQPGQVDENVLTIIYCKELEYRKKDRTRLRYEPQLKFHEAEVDGTSYANACDDVKVSVADERPYRLVNHPIAVPVYYFQGSHDGATLARGAIEHWRVVPRGPTYFMLAQKGGHNPNLIRLEMRQNTELNEAQKVLFSNAVTAQPISRSQVDAVNSAHRDPNQKWLLYFAFDWNSSQEIDLELKGILFAARLGPVQ